jgi:hypothetical protein
MRAAVVFAAPGWDDDDGDNDITTPRIAAAPRASLASAAAAQPAPRGAHALAQEVGQTAEPAALHRNSARPEKLGKKANKLASNREARATPAQQPQQVEPLPPPAANPKPPTPKQSAPSESKIVASGEVVATEVTGASNTATDTGSKASKGKRRKPYVPAAERFAQKQSRAASGEALGTAATTGRSPISHEPKPSNTSSERVGSSTTPAKQEQPTRGLSSLERKHEEGTGGEAGASRGDGSDKKRKRKRGVVGRDDDASAEGSAPHVPLPTSSSGSGAPLARPLAAAKVMAASAPDESRLALQGGGGSSEDVPLTASQKKKKQKKNKKQEGGQQKVVTSSSERMSTATTATTLGGGSRSQAAAGQARTAAATDRVSISAHTATIKSAASAPRPVPVHVAASQQQTWAVRPSKASKAVQRLQGAKFRMLNEQVR